MDLVVNYTRQKVEAAGVDRFVDGQLCCRIDIRDSIVFNNDRHPFDPIGEHDLCVLNNLAHVPNVAGKLQAPKPSPSIQENSSGLFR
jgi:hypothetical protein